MPLIKDNRFAKDIWVALSDEDALPVSAPVAPVIVSLERWRAERDQLLARSAPLGVRLRSDQAPAELAEDLRYFALIALEFPKFTDGRAYSHARLLRERYGFGGELRAVGMVLRDQYPFLLRCGFDAFEVTADIDLDDWRDALGEVSVVYQPATDRRRWVAALRQSRPAQRVARPAAPVLARHRDEEPEDLPSRRVTADTLCEVHAAAEDQPVAALWAY